MLRTLAIRTRARRCQYRRRKKGHRLFSLYHRMAFDELIRTVPAMKHELRKTNYNCEYWRSAPLLVVVIVVVVAIIFHYVTLLHDTRRTLSAIRLPSTRLSAESPHGVKLSLIQACSQGQLTRNVSLNLTFAELPARLQIRSKRTKSKI